MSNEDGISTTSNLESIYFELNETQLPQEIKYILDYHNQRMHFKRNEVDLYLTIYNKDLLNIKFKNSSENVQIISSDQLLHTTAYPSLNLKGINNYQSITYQVLYPNIDLVFGEYKNHISQTFIIYPKGNPKSIQLDMQASEKTEITDEGQLSILFREKVFYLAKPKAVQVINGVEVNVEARYHVQNKMITFNLESYDVTKPVLLNVTYDFSLIPNMVSESAFYIDSSKNQFIASYKTQYKDIKTVKAYALRLEWVRGLMIIFVKMAGMSYEAALDMIASWLQQVYRVEALTLKKVSATGELVQLIKQIELAIEPRELPKVTPLIDKKGRVFPVDPEILNDQPETMLPRISDLVVDELGNLYLSANIAGKKLDETKPKPNWYPKDVIQYNPSGKNEAALLKLNNHGLVSYMTYLSEGKSTSINSIALYKNELWMTGNATLIDGDKKELKTWPNIYIAHINASATQLLLSSQIGGEAIDYGKKILIHSNQTSYDVYVIGNVDNNVYIPEQHKPHLELGKFPTSPDAMQPSIGKDIFAVSAILKMDPLGNFIQKTYFDGGFGDTLIKTAAIDTEGNLYIAGTTIGGIKMGRLNGELAYSQVRIQERISIQDLFVR
ncbi:MAG TPA: hypothetical protein DCY20_00190 [Firmicutes bacterium]|nr:hypothetical protein [Bacillota bacterium]